MTRKEGWIAFAALVFTVIGAAFYLGSMMATEADVAGLRQEMREMRERSEAQMQELRERSEAQMQELRERSETQMQELRGYLVDHLDGHAN